jgi:hypothetical protein
MNERSLDNNNLKSCGTVTKLRAAISEKYIL